METYQSKSVTTKQRWLARLGQECPQRSFPSLISCIDVKWLQEAYGKALRTSELEHDCVHAYSINLENHLQALLERIHNGTYEPPPLTLQNGGQRSDSITRFEDKLLQQAVAMLLEPLYEQDFLDCSYGQRPGRSARQALAVMWQQLIQMGGGWVIELNISSLRTSVDGARLLQWLSRRIGDEQLCRLIAQWIAGGMLNYEQAFFCETGRHHDGPYIGSILLNLYLHEILDSWFESNVKKRLQDRSFIIRYKDNAILGFAGQADAKRVMMVVPKHFERYGMLLQPGTSRLVRFLPENREPLTQQVDKPCHHLVKQLCA